MSGHQQTEDPQVKPEVEDLADDLGDIHIEDKDLTVEEIKSSKYAVAKWKPVHDTVLALHMAGYAHKSIAAIVGLSPSHVTDLINDPRAQKAVQKIRKRLFENQLRNLEGKLTMLGDAAVGNLRKTVNADIAPKSKAKKHQDRVSMDVLDMIGVGQDGRGDDGMKLTKEASERLADAMEKADEAEQTHEIEMEPSEDGSYKPSENGSEE